MASSYRTRLLIIGSGPAGYAAAIYAARAGLNPSMVAGLQPGGQLTTTKSVEDYPGFVDIVDGSWLMEQMKAQAKHVGAAVSDDIITEVDFRTVPFVAHGDSGDRYVADSVIIATGAGARQLGIPGEQELIGFGVSFCAPCDGFFFRGKKVAVIGGGDAALEEALYLANLAKHVTVVHRRDHLRASRILQDRLLAANNVSVSWNAAPKWILGTASKPNVVRGVVLEDVNSGSRQRHCPRGRSSNLLPTVRHNFIHERAAWRANAGDPA